MELHLAGCGISSSVEWVQLVGAGLAILLTLVAVYKHVQRVVLYVYKKTLYRIFKMIKDWRYLRAYAPSWSVVDCSNLYMTQTNGVLSLSLALVVHYKASDRPNDTYSNISFSESRLEVVKSRRGGISSVYTLTPCNLDTPTVQLAPREAHPMVYVFTHTLAARLQYQLRERATVRIRCIGVYTVGAYTRPFKARNLTVCVKRDNARAGGF